MKPRTAVKGRRYGDRLLTPDSSPALTACDYAVAPFDRAALDADRTWGVDRLPELVAPETAAKWGIALAQLCAAIDAGKPDEVVQRVAVCLRGFAAMDTEARQRGHKPLTPSYWQADHDGRRVAIVREVGDWPLVARELPGATIYTLADAVAALHERATGWPRQDGAPPPPVARPATAIERDLDDAIRF
jgi:hypothetical protein